MRLFMVAMNTMIHVRCRSEDRLIVARRWGGGDGTNASRWERLW